MSSEETYPITSGLTKEIQDSQFYPESAVKKAVDLILESVGEYEHGACEVENVHPGLNMETYAAVARDICMILSTSDSVDERE